MESPISLPFILTQGFIELRIVGEKSYKEARSPEFGLQYCLALKRGLKLGLETSNLPNEVGHAKIRVYR